MILVAGSKSRALSRPCSHITSTLSAAPRTLQLQRRVLISIVVALIMSKIWSRRFWMVAALWCFLHGPLAAQNATITSAATSFDLFPPSGADCYASPSGPCLTEAYILGSCLSYYTFIDDTWGCYCSNNYPSAWTK